MTLRYVVLCYVMLCYVMLCYVMLCYVMLRYVTLRYVTLRYVTLRHVTSRYVTLCYVILHLFAFFILSFNILPGWYLSICNCCKPFFPLLYNCQLLCFWWLALKGLTLILLMWRTGWASNNASKWQMGFNLAFKGLSIVIEVFPLPFFRILFLQGRLLQTRYALLYVLSMSGFYFFILKVIFLLSPFEKLNHSLFFFFFIYWLYNPLWVLAFSVIFFHSALSSHRFFHRLTLFANLLQ